MKRVALKIVPFLLIGAIINIGVTWIAALQANENRHFWSSSGVTTHEGPTWEVTEWRYVAAARLESRRMFEGGTRVAPDKSFHPIEMSKYDIVSVPCWSRVSVQSAQGDRWTDQLLVSGVVILPPDGYEISDCMSEVAAGWPLLCLKGCFTMRLTGEPWTVSHGLLVRQRGRAVDPRSDVLLPFGPLWPGFAINTIFYAAVLWLLFAFPFVLRRRRRIKRGLCPKCGYDLRGRGGDATTCPECGEALGPRPAAES